MRNKNSEVRSRTAEVKTIAVFVLAACYLLLATFSFSQNVTATAELDTNAILIGQQAKIKLNVAFTTDQGNVKIVFPQIADTLIKQIQVIGKSKVETYVPDSSNMKHLAQSQTIIITSFDSGYYAIPPFKFIVNGDTSKPIETGPLLFTVHTVAVDTTIAIKDIKPPIEVPFNWREFLPYIYMGVGALAVLAGIIYLILYYIKKRKKKPTPEIIAPKIPPHVTALEQLEKLKEKKLWQAGKLKEYHSELSDIIRQYIEHRYFIHAMEQVTDEIMHSVRTTDMSDELKAKLRNILFLSDLVKFAKEQPLPNENEMSWTNAQEFVMASKPENKIQNPSSPVPKTENTTLSLKKPEDEPKTEQ